MNEDFTIPQQLQNELFRFVKLKDKIPFENSWQTNGYAFDDPQLLQHLKSEQNIGVIGGYGNLRIQDIDDKKLADELIEKFDTFTIRTGSGGCHFYFISDLDTNFVLKNDMGEFRGKNYQVVAPNMKHPNGNFYRIACDVPIKNIDQEELLEILKPHLRDKELQTFFGEQNKLPIIISNETDESRSAKEYKKVISLIRNGKTKEEVFSEMMLYSKWSGGHDAYRELTYDKALAFMESIQKYDDIINVEDFLIIEYNKRTGEELGRKVDIDKVAIYIEDNFQIRTIYGVKEETIEVYQDGIWLIKGKGIIKAEIERLLGVHAKISVVQEILEKIKRRTVVEREDTEVISDYKRAVRNGVLDLEDVDNIKLLPHSREYNFRTKWDIDYNPDAKYEKFMDLVNNALSIDDIKKFQEWNGLHLARRYFKKKFAIYHGAKDTSKSVFMNHLTHVLNNNVSGLTLQDIARGKPFDLLVLKDKDANICDDLSSSDMKAIGGVKKSVGDGFIDGEMKFGDKIRFPNTAKQTYACNKIPNSDEDIDDMAYYGRIILFAFDNVIPENEQDENLLKKITTEQEKSGWLNWAIEGYINLVKNGVFTNDFSPENTKYLMIKNGNSLAEFCSEVLQEDAGNRIEKEELYQNYCKWCLEHKPKLSPDSKEKIGRNLIRFAPYLQNTHSGVTKQWLNGSFRTTWTTFQNNMSSFRDSNNTLNNASLNNIYGFSKSSPNSPKAEIQDNIEYANNPRCPKCNGQTKSGKTMGGDRFHCLNYAYCGGII